MNEQTLLISLAALFTTGAVYLFGFIHGHRSGKADALHESELRANKASRKRALLSPAEDY